MRLVSELCNSNSNKKKDARNYSDHSSSDIVVVTPTNRHFKASMPWQHLQFVAIIARHALATPFSGQSSSVAATHDHIHRFDCRPLKYVRSKVSITSFVLEHV